MTKDEALRMAIEAMELHGNQYPHMVKGYILDAIQACKEALEQPAQEPVALLEALSDLEHQQWMKWAQSIIDNEPISEARKKRWLTMMIDYKDLPDNIQEYDREWARKVMAITHPAPPSCEWVGLSDEEIDAIFPLGDDVDVIDVARGIEAKLREKNNGYCL